MTDNEVESAYITTGKENTEEVIKFGLNPANILTRTEPIRIRDCTIPRVTQTLWYDFDFDVDGIVATLERFSDISASFTYLGILPREKFSLIKVYNIVRKHLPLASFSRKGLECLRWSVSTKMFEGDGFEFHLALLPKPQRTHFTHVNESLLQKYQYDFYDSFRNNFSKCIQSLSPVDISRGTFKKNSIKNIRKWRVLPDDRILVLRLLDEALQITLHKEEFEVTVLAFQLGQHDTSDEIIVTAFDVNKATISIHAAITISSKFFDQHLLWSRFGLQDIVGERGTFTTALTLSSCANFQTNLDGRILDITQELRQICNPSHVLHFVQFYADTPHLSVSYIHPTFGCIVSTGILHKEILKSLEKKSKEYLNICEENCLKLVKINARVEIVAMQQNSSKTIIAKDFIDCSVLQNLIAKYPLLVPFSNKTSSLDPQLTFSTFICSIPKHIHQTLFTLFEEKKNKGGFFDVWKAYQYEVANEKFWRGKPNSVLDNIFASNLGPGGSSPDRSLTWENGFLCLENSEVSALNNRSTPPLKFIKLSKIEENRIRRIFNFSDVLKSGEVVIGKRAVLILIQDIMADPYRIANCGHSLLANMRGKTFPGGGRFSGSITLLDLCNKLCNKLQYKHPYVFKRVLELIEEEGRNTTDVLIKGFQSLDIIYFPDLSFYDGNRNPKIAWRGNGYLKILYEQSGQISTDKSIEVTNLVIHSLESEGLVHSSKFRDIANDNNFSFPWISEILCNLMEEHFNIQLLTEICTYVSCIGLMQNNWYVSYENFQKHHLKIHKKLPNLTNTLQKHEILSTFRLQIFPHLTVMKLHDHLPYLISKPEEMYERSEKLNDDSENEDSSGEVERFEDMNPNPDDLPVNEIQRENIQKVPRKHCAAGFRGRWQGLELEILHVVKLTKPKSINAAYNFYLKLCNERNVVDRSFWSFKYKFKNIP